MTKENIDLDALGLGEPVKRNDKISIETLQRESEYEIDTRAQDEISARSRPQPRNAVLDAMAGFLGLVLPGAGHIVKARIWSAQGWFLLVIGLYALSILKMPITLIFLPIAIFAHIASAVIAIFPPKP